MNHNPLVFFAGQLLTLEQKVPIIERVNKSLADPDSPDVPRLKKEIDQLVYKLYDLTPEEIATVEGKE